MISKTFAYHLPSEDSLKAITKIRAHFSALEELLAEICPKSRELSVAQTNLEQAGMWAIKSVVSNDPLSTPLFEESPK